MNEPQANPTSPPTFRDSEGRDWTIKLTLGILNRVQEHHQIDLVPDNNDVSAITNLAFAPRKLAPVLWECVAAQAEAKGISREQFIDPLDGEALTAGWGALVDGVIFFIRARNPQLADAIAAAIEAQMQMAGAGAEAMLRTIQSDETGDVLRGAITRLEAEMQGEMRRALGNSATS